MRFALEVRRGRDVAAEFATSLEKEIKAAGGETVDPESEPDMVIAVGGDGTMLAGVRKALAYDVPVLGFNLGTMGFLTEADPSSLKEVVGRLTAGEFETVDRMTICATVDQVSTSGVNDVVVEKIDSQRLVELAVSIDGVDFTTYRADGIIIATPTGSSAYSFSAGGPLVDHSLDALILTPVAAHSLFDRSVVIPATSEIAIRVARDRSVHVTVDKNDLGHLATGETVIVSRGPQAARFVSLTGRPFVELVKSKFELG